MHKISIGSRVTPYPMPVTLVGTMVDDLIMPDNRYWVVGDYLANAWDVGKSSGSSECGHRQIIACATEVYLDLKRWTS